MKLRQPVVGSGVGDVSSFVYPVLATLASYPTHLDRKAQVCLLWRVFKFLSDTVLQKIILSDTVVHKIIILLDTVLQRIIIYIVRVIT